MKAQWLALSLAVLAAVMPFLRGRSDAGAVTDGFPGWAAAPVGGELSPIALGPRERRFAEQFPGAVAAFSEGETTWVLRWVRQPTRKLHPAADCLRGAGYAVTPTAAWRDGAGVLWGASRAERDGDRFVVRERILDATGRTWTDVSAWYWSALLGRSIGPWWSLTRIEPAAR